MQKVIVVFDKLPFGNVISNVAEKLQCKYCDIDEMIDYELVDSDKMIVNCGVDYFAKKEAGVIKNINNFDNTIFLINAETLIRNENYKNLEIDAIYFNIDEKLIKNAYNFELEDKILQIENKLAIKDINDNLINRFANEHILNKIDANEIINILKK